MAAVEPVVELLHHRAVPDGRVIVTSMSDATVRRLRALAPELPLAPGRYWTIWFLVRTRLRVPPRRAPYVAIQVPHRHEWGATVFSGRLGPLARRLPTWLRSVRVIDPRFVRAAHRARMAVHAWTIDDEAEMGQLLGMGVDGLMTDRPSVLAALLRGQPGPDERKAP
jgi:glycerophosphoryl diester phosphodiesterase